MSGFCQSLESRRWKPSGSPAIAHLIEALDSDEAVDLDLVMTRPFVKGPERKALCHLNKQTLKVDGIGAKILLLVSPEVQFIPARLKFFVAELMHLSSLSKKIRCLKPDIIYIDRGNWFLAAVITRFTSRPVVMRLLGIPVDMWRLENERSIFNMVMKWAYRSPFTHVICTEDGSAGREWMNKYLADDVKRSTYLNGVKANNGSSDRMKKAVYPVKVVFLGRIELLKGADFFVESLLLLSAEQRKLFSPVVVGGGELLPQLQERVATAGLGDWIRFTGSVTSGEVGTILNEADLYVSLNIQGHVSNASLEAMSFGVPFLIRELPRDEERSGGIAHLLDKGGYLSVDSDISPDDFADVLVELCADHCRLSEMRQSVCLAKERNLIDWNVRIAKEVSLLKDLARGAEKR